MAFALTDKNKEALENCTELLDEIQDQIELIRGNKPIEYKKDFIKIKFESADDLPLSKILDIPLCVIIVRCIFQENNKYYPQVFSHECFYEYEYEYEGDSSFIVYIITFKKINLNHSYYFFNDIKNIDPNFVGINRKCMKNTDDVVYEIKYIMMQSINNQNIDRGNPLCLSFSDVDAYIIEENENKYLIFALTENNKEVLELYKIKKQIKAINSGESIKYKNDFMKIRFDSYDDLPLSKIL